MGSVNSSLEKFDRAISATGKVTADVGSDMKKSIGTDLRESISSVEREYRT
jgi:hypothetical protein